MARNNQSDAEKLLEQTLERELEHRLHQIASNDATAPFPQFLFQQLAPCSRALSARTIEAFARAIETLLLTHPGVATATKAVFGEHPSTIWQLCGTSLLNAHIQRIGLPDVTIIRGELRWSLLGGLHGPLEKPIHQFIERAAARLSLPQPTHQGVGEYAGSALAAAMASLAGAIRGEHQWPSLREGHPRPPIPQDHVPLREVVDLAMAQLSPLDRAIVQHQYVEGGHFETLGTLLSLTPEEVAIRHDRALLRLHTALSGASIAQEQLSGAAVSNHRPPM